MIENIRDYSLPELEAKFKILKLQPYRARQVFEWLYKKGVEDFAQMTNLSREFRDIISKYFTIEKITPEKIETSSDLTQKFLFRLSDGALIESVSIPFKSRLTACISTQVGCRFSCFFCASGMGGFKRNLSVSEILGQVVAIKNNVPEGKISNLVFMGVGEPLDNYDNLLKSIRIINDEHGIHLGIRKMTISTSGLAPAIDRLAKEGLEIELSVSLHASSDEKRDQIMPINKRFPLDVLLKSVKNYIELTNRKVTFEYILLGGFNTSVEDAQELIKLLRKIHSKVNLIPYNPAAGRVRFEPPAKLEVLFFKSYLEKNGIEVTIRMPRGKDIAAACGQLRFNAMENKK